MTSHLVRAQRVGKAGRPSASTPVTRENTLIPRDRDFRMYCYNQGVKPVGETANVLFHVWRASGRVHKSRLLARAVSIILSCEPDDHGRLTIEDIASSLEENL